MNKLQLLFAFMLAGIVPSFMPNFVMASPAKNSPNSTYSEIKTLDNRLAQSLTEVTNIKVDSTDNGLEVILETPVSDNLKVINKTEGNSFIVDIPNARLRFPSGSSSFIRQNPTKGIASIIVNNTANNSIQLIVKGQSGVPQVELFDGEEGLVFAVTPANSTVTETQFISSSTESTSQLLDGGKLHYSMTLFNLLVISQ
jgi:iron complex outermembrane recepter protein